MISSSSSVQCVPDLGLLLVIAGNATGFGSIISEIVVSFSELLMSFCSGGFSHTKSTDWLYLLSNSSAVLLL